MRTIITALLLTACGAQNLDLVASGGPAPGKISIKDNRVTFEGYMHGGVKNNAPYLEAHVVCVDEIFQTYGGARFGAVKHDSEAADKAAGVASFGTYEWTKSKEFDGVKYFGFKAELLEPVPVEGIDHDQELDEWQRLIDGATDCEVDAALLRVGLR